MGSYNTILDYPSASGVMPLIYSIRDGVPLAFDALLLGIFLILFAGNYFLIKNRTGRAKILVGLMSSLFVMIPMSLMLAMGQIVTFASVLFYAFFLIIVFILFMVSDND